MIGVVRGTKIQIEECSIRDLDLRQKEKEKKEKKIHVVL